MKITFRDDNKIKTGTFMSYSAKTKTFTVRTTITTYAVHINYILEIGE